MIEHFLIQNGALSELPLPEVSDTLLATIFNGTKVPGFETETLPQVQHFQPASFPVSFDVRGDEDVGHAPRSQVNC
jgi:hypothetical protein